MAVVIVPMSQRSLFSAALSAGFRVVKVLNSMTLDTYATSPGPSFPSVRC